MTTTSQIRSWWDPACQANAADLRPAYQALDDCLKKHGYKPRLGVTGAFNCRTITGGTGYSLHAYDPSGIFTFWTGVRVTMALAVDINWDKNPYGPTLVTDMPAAMIAEIKAIRTNNGKQLWRWGGDYGGNKDAMHFEIIVSPADLATGIKTPDAPTPPQEEEEDMETIIWFKKDDGTAHAYNVSGNIGKWLSPEALAAAYYVKMPQANLPESAYPANYRETKILADGPCRNTPVDISAAILGLKPGENLMAKFREEIAKISTSTSGVPSEAAMVTAMTKAIEASGLQGLLPGK